MRASDPLSARPLLEKAIGQDPDFAAAHAALARVLGLLGERTLVAWARLVEGDAQRLSGQSAKALAAFEDVQRTYEVEGDRWGMALALDGRARVFEDEGKWDEMRSALDEASSLRAKIGDRKGMARGLERIAASRRAAGDLGEAKKSLIAAAGITSALGAHGAGGSVQAALADVLADLAQLPAARKAAETARDEARAAHDAPIETAALAALSRIDLLLGDVAAARKNGDAAVERVEKSGPPEALSRALAANGLAQLAARDTKAARSALERAAKVASDAKVQSARLERDLDLLSLASAESRWEDVARDGPTLVKAFQALGRRDGEARARLLLLEALQARHQQGDAEVESEKVFPLADKSENPELRFASGLVRARRELAKGFSPAADKAARIVERDANRLGLVPLVLEARLVLGRIQASKGKTTILEDVKKRAEERGLLLIAFQAEDLLLHR